MIDEIKEIHTCYHCGEKCAQEDIEINDKHFCCGGCKTVYEILNRVELCDYYRFSEKPGISQKHTASHKKFTFLDDKELQQRLIQYKDDEQSHVTLYLPQMHCSSCVWLLEHLNRLNRHIIRSQVNFLKKELSIVYEHGHISLREVTELLASIGYEPHFSLHNVSSRKAVTYDKSRIYRIGITGFCFGNIMLLSFPEYFSLGNMEEKGLRELFSYLNLALSLPVFFYGAAEFFGSAIKSFRQKFLNIDTPIALAILITFVRSVYEILSGTGAGYLDSMTGIVFFMLIGRFFQDKTYNTLTFNRDYTSYFPLGVSVINDNGEEKQIPVSDLKAGQRIKIYSQEIVPADCILFLGKANIDYSFVTGEALPVEKTIGEIIYAGGKQLGGALEMEVVKEVSQSYLTQLWNNEAFRKSEAEKSVSYIHLVSRYFTIVLFCIALSAAAYWKLHDPSRLWNAITSILIVACPCALLLSATFTNGSMLRILQRFGFYVRNAWVIEQIANTTGIVFDKTGTITEQRKSEVSYLGKALSADDMKLVRSLAAQSGHPLSRAIVQALPFSKTMVVRQYDELKGLGIKGIVNGNTVMIGSADFVTAGSAGSVKGSKAYVKINNEVPGYFTVQTQYRKGLEPLLARLRKKYKTSLLSGDNATELMQLKALFNGPLLFNQLPQNKLEYIKKLQQAGQRVLMIGDGLNDAGALKQSNIGIAVTDNINNFSPACDVIMEGKALPLLDQLLLYCEKNKLIINISFATSILYNLIGLYFAVQGRLEPVIAAILMPASSISIILLTTGLSTLFSYPVKRAWNKLRGPDINHAGY